MRFRESDSMHFFTDIVCLFQTFNLKYFLHNCDKTFRDILQNSDVLDSTNPIPKGLKAHVRNPSTVLSRNTRRRGERGAKGSTLKVHT